MNVSAETDLIAGGTGPFDRVPEIFTMSQFGIFFFDLLAPIPDVDLVYASFGSMHYKETIYHQLNAAGYTGNAIVTGGFFTNKTGGNGIFHSEDGDRTGGIHISSLHYYLIIC